MLHSMRCQISCINSMLGARDRFALTVDRAALLEDRSLAPQSTYRAARMVNGSTNGFALTTNNAAQLIDSGALSVVRVALSIFNPLTPTVAIWVQL